MPIPEGHNMPAQIGATAPANANTSPTALPTVTQNMANAVSLLENVNMRLDQLQERITHKDVSPVGDAPVDTSTTAENLSQRLICEATRAQDTLTRIESML